MKDIAINNCSKQIGGPLHNLYCNVTTGICEDYYTSKYRAPLIRQIGGRVGFNMLLLIVQVMKYRRFVVLRVWLAEYFSTILVDLS